MTKKNTASPRHSSSVSQEEINQFNDLSSSWWDINGPMAPLHRMNPVRLEYIVDRITAHYGAVKGLRILDIGCGGGLVAEPLVRLGAHVTGIDGASDLIAVAQHHAASQDLKIEYRACLTDTLLARKETFDVVLGLEVIEHIPDQQSFINDVAALTKKNGLALFSTINRSAHGFALGIVAAEYLLRWLPAGTHEWKNFVKPSELAAWADTAGLTPQHLCGIVYKPLQQHFVLDERNLNVNYFLTAVKK